MTGGRARAASLQVRLMPGYEGFYAEETCRMAVQGVRAGRGGDAGAPREAA